MEGAYKMAQHPLMHHTSYDYLGWSCRFDLVGLLVEIVEQSVVFTALFNDWNESEGNGVWKEEQG